MAEALEVEKMNRLRNRLIAYKLMEKAQQSIGEYPAVVQGKKRTKEMEGFNECLKVVELNRKAADQWWGSLTAVNKSFVADLILDDLINLEVEDRTVRMWVDVSNIFSPQVDTETIHLSDVQALHVLTRTYPSAGIYAYVAWKRQAHPHDKSFEKRMPEFRDALQAMST